MHKSQVSGAVTYFYFLMPISECETPGQCSSIMSETSRAGSSFLQNEHSHGAAVLSSRHRLPHSLEPTKEVSFLKSMI